MTKIKPNYHYKFNCCHQRVNYSLFRNTNYLKKKEPEFTDVSVSNDLTKTEREDEKKKQWEEAKNMTAKDTSGKYQCKVW